MNALEIFQFATSSGVLAGGLGILKWGFTLERRMTRLELKDETRENRETDNGFIYQRRTENRRKGHE